MTTSSSKEEALLPAPVNTRLVTIIAHVDHGKTTLADNLIESNGIISERHAGTIRYLDSLAEEQRRGITMRSSAIALRHFYRRPMSSDKDKNTESNNNNMVIHLIDSPGHVDFSMEVTSALQMCDVALLVVDAVEGMCARTQSLLREAYRNELVPILVINKMDRLCTELSLNVTEAHSRVRLLVESVNAAASAMIQSAIAFSSDTVLDNNSTHLENSQTGGCNPNDKEEDNEIWTFDPTRGNVIFASALYGWAFTIPSLARSLFKSKLIPIKPLVLRQYLFGDYKFHADTCKITKRKTQQYNNMDDETSLPMFAEFGLKPLWEIYEGVATAAASLEQSSVSHNNNETTNSKSSSCRNNLKIKATTPGMDHVLSSLQVGSVTSSSSSNPPCPTTPKTLEQMQVILNETGASSEESVLRALLRRYRPLSDSVLDAVCEYGPSPAEASSSFRTRALALQQSEDSGNIQEAVRACSTSESAPVVAHVCKFVATDRSFVSDPTLLSKTHDDDWKEGMIIGLGRVLCGTLRDVEYYAFGPKYKGLVGDVSPKRKIRIYLIMGSSFVRVPFVPAGHICGILGLEDLQLKTVTLCDQRNGMPLQGFDLGLRPLVKVNVEAVFASDTDALERGLIKLSLADAAVEVMATAKGERILACLGEIHLEQSILDLETKYCGKEMKLRISDPIVEFGESTTFFENEDVDYEQFFDESGKSVPLRQVHIPPYCYEGGLNFARRGRSRAVLPGQGAAICVRVVPLSRSVYESLKSKRVAEGSEKEFLRLKTTVRLKLNEEEGHSPDGILSALLAAVCVMDENGNAMIENAGLVGGKCVRGVISDDGKVFVPQSKTPVVASKMTDKYNNDQENDVGTNSVIVSGLAEYNAVQSNIRSDNVDALFFTSGETPGDISDMGEHNDVAYEIWKSDMRGSAVAGFGLAMRAGPFCEEPVRGVLVVIEGVEVGLKKPKDLVVDYVQTLRNENHISGGLVVKALRTGIRTAMITRPARLVEGHLRLTLHSSLTGLGSLYAVLSKRRGKVLNDTMVEGTDLIHIAATIPQAESFRLAPELLIKSSGEVTAPELVFSHWELLEDDPFWIPSTMEEREDYGEIVVNGDCSTGLDNTALKYIRMVRKRKGLMVDSSKIVVAAEKQRTLARKK